MPYPWGTKNRYHQSYLVKWNVPKTQVPVRDNVRQNNTDALAAHWTGQWSSVIIGELLCLWARISGTQADSEHIMQLQMTTNLGWSWASCGRAWITFFGGLFSFSGDQKRGFLHAKQALVQLTTAQLLHCTFWKQLRDCELCSRGWYPAIYSLKRRP